MTTACERDAATLREAMAAELQEMGELRSESLVAAVRTVPRHAFTPEQSLQVAYEADRAVVTKRDEQGLATSSVSATHIQVVMLEQAQIEPGMRVLEVGTGGYNAALIAEMVGDSGDVTTIDIDPEIVDRARNCLNTAGYPQVDVVLGDAEHGHPPKSPYDRVVVTAGAWDVPPAWWQQLAPGGRLVVPLRLRGMTRSVTFGHDDDRLVSEGYRLCGFVPMQGESSREERLVPLDGNEVALRVEEPQLLDVAGLQRALLEPSIERWSGVRFDQVDEMDFFIATSASTFGLLSARQGAIERGVVAWSASRSVPALIRGASFAYRTKRPIEGTEDFETGVYGHGPEAQAVAEDYVRLLQQWDSELRGGSGARIEALPTELPDNELPGGRLFKKAHTRIVVSWPGAGL